MHLLSGRSFRATTPAGTPPGESIEFRTLAFFD